MCYSYMVFLQLGQNIMYLSFFHLVLPDTRIATFYFCKTDTNIQRVELLECIKHYRNVIL